MSSSSSSPRTSGSHPIGPTNKKRPWWLLLLAGIVAVVLLLLLLTRCGSDDSSSTGATSSSSAPASGATTSTAPASSAAPSTTSSTTASATPAPTAATGASASSPATVPSVPAVPSGTGSLTAGTTSLLPLSAASPDGSLRAFNDQAVTATAVQVLSVPADEGFWVGTSDTDRVWVQIIGSGESPYKVQPGDVVDFTGSMVKHATGFASKIGVDDREGAHLLQRQRAHIAAEQSTLTLTAS